MPLPRQRAHIVGEDEILEIARRAELDAWHDVVELETEFRETRLANQHDGAAADQVGDDFARDLRHRGLLLLLAGAEREPDRVEIEKHGHGVADLQHGAGKFEPRRTAPGIPRGHVEQERVVFRAGQGAGEVVVRLAGRDRCHQPATEEKTEQENDDPLHGYDLAPARRLRRLDVLSPESAAASMAGPLTWSRGHRSIARKTRRAPSRRARKRGLPMFRLLSIALAWAMVAVTAIAQTGDDGWPERPVRLVVPFPAGSSTDIIARIVAQKLSRRLGQQIVIENRAGASGNIGADAVAKAAPDGYTMGIATASTHAVAASLSANLPYDPIKDFAPVAMIGSQPYVLVLQPALPARNLAELIALAKAKPGTLNYGSAGVASLAHLATALFASMAGVNIVHVPYKSSSQSMTDMITGRLDMQFATIAPSLPNIRAGQLRALATSGKTRVAALPELPTVAEAGLAGYEAALWVSLVMPSATPPTMIARLNREVNDILKSTEGTEALVAQGMVAEPGPPEALTERIRGDIEKWRGVAVKAGIRPE